jgi:glycerate 2-kinase
MLYACGGEQVTITVKDPLWRDIDASYIILSDNTAVIEMAAASGLPLLSENEKNPLVTTTYGTGQLIAHALNKGCGHIVIGLGGSATHDGGIGMGAALGIRFLHNKEEVPLCGQGMEEIDEIDSSGIHPKLRDAKITIACDVRNPMLGENGAAYIYSPQKGASPDVVKRLEAGLKNLVEALKRENAYRIEDIPGSGAAGGMSGLLLIYSNAQIKHGLDILLDAMHFEKQLEDCDMIITGEGRTDKQSTMGKVISGISKRAKRCNIPVIVISGTIENGSEELFQAGVTSMFSACRHLLSLEDTLSDAKKDLYRIADNLFRLLKAVS